MMKKTFYLGLGLFTLAALLSPISTYAQQCDQSFAPKTIRQGESQTVSDSMTNPSSNPFVVEQLAIEYQGGASSYVQGSPFVSQPYSSIASDIVAGSSTVSLGGVNGFVVTNAAARDFVIRFKVQGYHIEANDACIANPALPCTALSYLTHYECQPLIVTKCGDGIVDAGYEQCDGTAGVEANQSCSNTCQIISAPVLCTDPNAENNGSTTQACIYKYACNNNYQCVQQKGGQYSSSNCDNKCTPPVLCNDPNAENNGSTTQACIYKYACNNNYQCVQQKGGSYGSSNCDNKCTPPVLCNDPNAENNGSTTQACIYKYACNNNYQCVQQKGGAYGSNNCNNACGTAPYCGDGVRNNGEVCDFNDGSRNNWGNSGCSNQCQQVNNPVCQDPNAENQGQVGSCIYKYACNNNYQCVQQKGGQYSSSNCNNVCVAPAQADVQITKTVDRPAFPNTAGERITWTLTYKNNGPAAAENVVVVDILPESLRKVVSMTMNAGKIEAGGKYTWYLGTLQPGQGGAITIVSEYEGGKADNTDLTNVVSIATSTNGDNPNNNNGSATTKPYSNPTLVDVQIVKSVDRSTFPNKVGEIITWTLDYKNNGPATATNVVVVDIIPKELTYLLGSVDGSKYTFTAQAQSDGTTKVTWIFKNPLPVGTTGSFVVKTEYRGGYPDNKDILNAVAITATNDSNPNNNSDSEVTKPVSGSTPQADVQIVKSVDRPTFPNKTGEIITWTLNYKNNGPSAAQSVVVRDVLPEGLEFVSATSGYNFVPVNTLIKAPCNFDTPSWHCKSYYVWTLGTLQVGQTGSITVVSRYVGGIANASALTNHTDISTTTAGDNPNNNTGSAVTTPYGSGTASLGNYVWIDKDKDGIQDTDEVVLSGVKVDLYKITSCAADLGTPIMTTTTNGSGLYLFTGLEAGSYKVKFTLPNGYEFTMPNQGSDDTVDSDAGLNGLTNCIGLKEGENNMTVDAGVYTEQPVSCEGLTISPGTIKVNQSVSYNCTHKNATSAVITVTMSGSTGAVVMMTGFTGQFTIGAVGTYNVQCTLDNGITYKVVAHAATNNAIICAYKKQTATNLTCAVKTALDPFVVSQVNLSGLIYMPTPYSYCSTEQLADTTYQCVDAPAGSQILTRVDNMCRAQLIVTSGGGGGGCKSCGGSNYCGNNKVDTGEECDGNDKLDYICTNQCKYKPKGTYQTGSHNPAKIKGLPSCESIDPPSVNKGEYLPFWWELESDSDITFVPDCSNAVVGKTNVVKGGSDRSDDPLCHFTMYVDDTAKTPAAEFTKYCYQDAELTSEPLFGDFFSTRPVSLQGYQRSKIDGGSSFFGPSNWSDVPNKYGEYKLALDSSTFYVCEQITKANGTKEWKQSAQRYIAKNDGGYVNECSFNFTVTTPYFVQQGKSLGTTDTSRAVMNNFHSFDTRGSIIDNIVQISQYQRTSNLTYLGKQFADKYTKLAGPYSAYFRKVAGKEIYVKVGTDNLFIAGGDLPRGTIISNGGDITIQGDVKGRVMMIANGGTIYFKSPNPDEIQLVEGIYIADHVKSSTRIRNDNLASENWADKGGLRIKGIVVSTDPTDIEQIYNSRRSYIEDYWFQTNTTNSNYKRDAILNGAALTIETDPSFWTSLPPGANELMSALETYK